MNISLPKALENYVRKKVKSGRYGSSSEVVRDGLRMLQARDSNPRFREADREARLEELRRLVQEGLDDLDAGRVVSAGQFEDWFRQLHRDKVRKLRRSKAS